MKPILQYPGGKSQEIKYFKDYIPKNFNTYYEPFLGGGAVFFYLEPQKAVISDVNERLINFYQGVKIKDINPELKELSERYKNENPKELYYHMRDVFNGKAEDKYSEETVYYFINHASYRALFRTNSRGELNTSFGYIKTLKSALEYNTQKLLQKAKIKYCSYEESFRLASEKDFIFIDPPYTTDFHKYGNQSDFGEEEQRKLAQDFKNLNSKALMIINKDKLTEELYRSQIKDEYGKNYSISFKGNYKSKQQHLIITNY